MKVRKINNGIVVIYQNVNSLKKELVVQLSTKVDKNLMKETELKHKGN